MTPAERAKVFREAAEAVREMNVSAFLNWNDVPDGADPGTLSDMEYGARKILRETARELEHRASVEETRVHFLAAVAK